MNQFFKMQDGQPYFTEVAQQVPELKHLIDKFPDQYDRFGAYIFHMTSPRSAYFDYGPEKESEIIKDYLPEFKGKRLPKLIPECIAKINSFKTAEMRLLESSLQACDKIGNYLQTLDFSEVDENGRLLHSPTQVMNSLSKIANLVEGIQKVREQVNKGMQSEEEYYGSRELNMFDQLIEGNE